MKEGLEARILVSDLDEEGAGVGRATTDETVAHLDVHIPGALPGEEVSATLDKVSSVRPLAWASLRGIHQRSPQRVPPRCQAHGACGGCVLQHLDVAAQLAWKQATLARLVAGQPSLASVSLLPPVPSPLAYGYRNNSKLVAARDHTGQLVLGAYAPRSHVVVNLAGCEVTEPALGTAAADLADALRIHGVDPYDENKLVGTLRYAILRANSQGQVLVTLVTAADSFPAAPDVVATLLARNPRIVGVVQNINPTRGNAIYGARQKILAGEGTIDDQIGGVRLRLSPRAFFQANRLVAAAAYEAISRLVGARGDDAVVDAYAGVGGIALTLAPAVRTVVGLEENADAVANARFSADLNGISNTVFRAGDAAALLSEIAIADVLVLNPPRKGCHPAVLERTATLAPRTIAYLACSATTLVRDLVALDKYGYRTNSLTAFDMLPHTAHIEILAILTTSGH